MKYNNLLLWKITDKCNLNCSFCISRSNKTNNNKIKKIDINLISNFNRNTNKIFHIQLSGGEPFIIPNIIEIIERLIKVDKYI